MKHLLIALLFFTVFYFVFAETIQKEPNNDNNLQPIVPPFQFLDVLQTNQTTPTSPLGAIVGGILAIVICCCFCFVAVVAMIVICACVGVSSVAAYFAPCIAACAPCVAAISPLLVALGCGACAGAVVDMTIKNSSDKSSILLFLV